MCVCVCVCVCVCSLRITLRVRKLLLLIPTDPEVQDALDNFVPKESSVWSHQVRSSCRRDLSSVPSACLSSMLLYLSVASAFPFYIGRESRASGLLRVKQCRIMMTWIMIMTPSENNEGRPCSCRHSAAFSFFSFFFASQLDVVLLV